MSQLAQCSIRRHDIGKRAIFVVDGLFDEQFIRMVHHYMSRLQFALSGYDTPQTKHLLHWNHEFDLENLPSIPLIPELVSRTVAVSTELFSSSRLQLQRMHCNAQNYGDMQNVHTDLTPGVTALYFANPLWETDWMGETIFYNDDNEPLYAVIPKPGRLLIFTGDIMHRGGVPSRQCLAPRLSVAFKFVIESGPAVG